MPGDWLLLTVLPQCWKQHLLVWRELSRHYSEMFRQVLASRRVPPWKRTETPLWTFTSFPFTSRTFLTAYLNKCQYWPIRSKLCHIQSNCLPFNFIIRDSDLIQCTGVHYGISTVYSIHYLHGSQRLNHARSWLLWNYSLSSLQPC